MVVVGIWRDPFLWGPSQLGYPKVRPMLHTLTHVRAPTYSHTHTSYKQFSGWRSWYAFYTSFNQSMIVDVIDALSAKNRTVKGWEGQVSLCDLGYCSAGLDEGWEGCGDGVNGTQHYVNGTPAINTHSFPDMKELVDYGHAKVCTIYSDGLDRSLPATCALR